MPKVKQAKHRLKATDGSSTSQDGIVVYPSLLAVQVVDSSPLAQRLERSMPFVARQAVGTKVGVIHVVIYRDKVPDKPHGYFKSGVINEYHGQGRGTRCTSLAFSRRRCSTYAHIGYRMDGGHLCRSSRTVVIARLVHRVLRVIERG